MAPSGVVVWLIALSFSLVQCQTSTLPSANDTTLDQISAKTGRFLVHILRSEYFFDKAVPADFMASLEGRPDLPLWLHLAQSPRSSEAFLYGTPESQNVTEIILVIAKSRQTFELKRKRFLLNVRYDSRHSFPMAQMAELWITNLDTWELLMSSELMSELRTSISRAFRGKGVRPYIRDLKPATLVGQKVPLSKDKVGVAVYVATQKENGFPYGIMLFSKGLLLNPEKCQRNEIVALDPPFRPKFKIDWCQFRLSSVTRTNAEQTALLFDKQEVRPVLVDGSVTATPSVPKIVIGSLFFRNEPDDAYYFGKRRDYFWDWVMVAAVPCAILLVLLLFLSFAFFGYREGQHWRDRKTPDGQLSEYVNLRRTQVRLRLLSNQRQSLDFLDGGSDQLRTTTPVGKQTVADAAACRGSSLQLYENGTGYGLDTFDNGKPKETMLILHANK